MRTLRISDKTKKEFDEAQAELIGRYKTKFTHDQTIKFLTKLYRSSCKSKHSATSSGKK
jgi:hypothetical protein